MFTCELTHKFHGGMGAPMEYKGIEYSVVQTTNPVGWKWIAYLPGRPPKTGTSTNRKIALLHARSAIDQAVEVRPTKSGLKK